MAPRRAVVVGAGPNGLVAAVNLARAGWDVTVLEAGPTPGGGTRSAELTLPGVTHDVCSAIHPLGLASPALRDLPLGAHGLRWVQPVAPVAHVLDRRRAVVLEQDLAAAAAVLGPDGPAWRRLMGPVVDGGGGLVDAVLSPLDLPPRHPVRLARLGLRGALPATTAARALRTDEARALFAGLAAHSVLPLEAPATAMFGVLLGGLAHLVGWPMAAGGSQSIADALVSLLAAHGGTVECGHEVRSLDDLPPVDAVVLDVGPRALVRTGGERVPPRYRRALERFRHGPGTFKLDWALAGPIPWARPDVAGSATVHLGGTLEQIALSESEVARGRHPTRPYVLLAQQSLFDPARVDPAVAPPGTQAAWAYCHVPAGSTLDMTARIEAVVEEAAPGFRDLVVARHAMDCAAMERHDANYVGGDITGGSGDLRQILTRPTVGLHPWRTPMPGVYLCSASTPPGAGVHGMCGLHAARTVLDDLPG